jgi:hypothetical protein
MTQFRLRHVLLLTSALLLPAIGRADTEDVLNANWRAQWAISRVELFSNCDNFYNDNELRGSAVLSKAGRRFAEGETLQVSKVNVKRGRVDLFLDLGEPVLKERRDGPFTLYDEARCKVQLQVPLPDSALRDPAAAERLLLDVLDRHPDRRSVESSRSWNRRRREAYPPDYDETLAEYEVWKATEVNRAIDARIARAAEDAQRALDRMRRDPDYLYGFAAGVEAQSSPSLGGCAGLAAVTLSEKSAPSSEKKSAKDARQWENGYRDGQILAFALELLSELPRCRMPIPAPR